MNDTYEYNGMDCCDRDLSIINNYGGNKNERNERHDSYGNRKGFG